MVNPLQFGTKAHELYRGVKFKLTPVPDGTFVVYTVNKVYPYFPWSKHIKAEIFSEDRLKREYEIHKMEFTRTPSEDVFFNSPEGIQQELSLIEKPTTSQWFSLFIGPYYRRAARYLGKTLYSYFDRNARF
jgi:hypothetical protein